MKRWIEQFLKDEDRASKIILNWLVAIGMASWLIAVGAILLMK